jgi:predicted choloylglycine hydrolase
MPTSVFRRRLLCGLLIGLLLATAARGDDTFRYKEGKHGKGELKYISDLPVLCLQGTPEEMGQQAAVLTTDAARFLIDYPKELLAIAGKQELWPRLLQTGNNMLPQFPADHLAEMEAFSRKSGFARDLLVGVNTMVDSYRGEVACSSLLVDPQRSVTGGPLFGRNLDYFSLGKLHKYSLVTVCRPKNKHAFVSITFPGLFGCLSGMNDAGLALAVHEVLFARDRSPMFDPQGVPYLLAFRRILEECTTIDEAEKLLRSIKRTTRLNLAVCDRRGGAVIEFTPTTLVVRRGEDGICACANHFCTKPLATLAFTFRYRALLQAKQLPQVTIEDVAAKLDEVNLGRLTMQSMIFEPVPLVLHLAIGSLPASALPMKRLELAPLFSAGGKPRLSSHPAPAATDQPAQESPSR